MSVALYQGLPCVVCILPNADLYFYLLTSISYCFFLHAMIPDLECGE